MVKRIRVKHFSRIKVRPKKKKKKKKEKVRNNMKSAVRYFKRSDNRSLKM